MVRRCIRLLSFLSFTVSLLLAAGQGALVCADIVLFVFGKQPIFFVLAGAGAQSGFSVALTLWLYFSFTAYAAFWFVAGMGLRQFSVRASE